MYSIFLIYWISIYTGFPLDTGFFFIRGFPLRMNNILVSDIFLYKGFSVTMDLLIYGIFPH